MAISPQKHYFSDYTQQTYTKKGFLELIEKRLRKELRLDRRIKSGMKVVLPEDGRLSTQILAYFLDVIFEGRVEVSFVNTATSILVSTDCMDEYINSRLNVFLKNDDIALLQTTLYTPLHIITAKECVVLGLLLDIKGVLPVEPLPFVTELQKEYIQTKTSFVKSFENLSNLISTAKSSKKDS